MSGALSNAITYVSTAIFSAPRSIGVYLPDCAIEERAVDQLTLTRHPVQRGAKISDHAYIEPAQVTLHWAWSNSAPANMLANIESGNVLATLGFGSAETYAKTVYANLLALQRSGATIKIVTGKRTYPSMMIVSLSQITSEKTEYALICDIVCEEVIIANTQATTQPTQANQAQPQQTSPQQNQGTQQPTTTPTPAANPAGAPAGAPTGYQYYSVQT